MKIKYLLFLFLLNFQITSGQTFNLDNQYSLFLPELIDWKVSKKYCDTVKNVCQFLQIHKEIQSTEREFSSITIQYTISNDNMILEKDNRGCSMGFYTKIDSVLVSGYVAKRWFGVNCGWIDDSGKNRISGYSLDLIIALEHNKYLTIATSYFTADKIELSKFEIELITLIGNFKLRQYE